MKGKVRGVTWRWFGRVQRRSSGYIGQSMGKFPNRGQRRGPQRRFMGDVKIGWCNRRGGKGQVEVEAVETSKGSSQKEKKKRSKEPGPIHGYLFKLGDVRIPILIRSHHWDTAKEPGSGELPFIADKT